MVFFQTHDMIFFFLLFGTFFIHSNETEVNLLLKPFQNGFQNFLFVGPIKVHRGNFLRSNSACSGVLKDISVKARNVGD